MPVTQSSPTQLIAPASLELGANWRLQFIQPDGVPLSMAGLEVIDFGAISYKEIFQNVKTILATPLYSAVLERTLGLDNTIVDLPITNAPEVTIAILTAVTLWEPRVQVMNIDFQADPLSGHLRVNLQLQIKNVIYSTNAPYAQATIPAIPPGAYQPPPPSTWEEVSPIIKVVFTPVGTPGPRGIPGERGSLWFTGDGAPSAVLNVKQYDMYLDNLSGDVYQFDGAFWKRR